MIEVRGLLFLKYNPFQFENFWEICVKFFLPDLEKDAEADLQKMHDKYIKKVEELLANKEKEIMTV